MKSLATLRLCLINRFPMMKIDIGYGNLPLISRIKIRDTEQKHWKSLLNSLEANPFQSLLLSTKSDNDNALRLYKKFGFTLTGETNGDEVILKKYIN